MRALGIARVSSQEQAAEDRYSLANQKERIAAYCRERGWDLVQIVEYVGSGGSNQKELRAVMSTAAQLQVGCVVVFELDRLSRNIVSTLMFIDDLREKGIRFAAVANEIDLTTPEGELQLHLLSAFAHYFRAQLGRKVRGGQELRVREGKVFGRVKFGYRIGPDGRLVPHETEAATVRMVYDWYTKEDIGLRAIAQRLNALGVATHEGKQWSVASVRLLFDDPGTYLGEVTYGKYQRRNERDGKLVVTRRSDGYLRVAGAHEPILDRETVDQARSRRAARAAMGSKAASSKHLLTGLLRCGKCGGPMQTSGAAVGADGRSWNYYVCSNYVRRGTCQRNSIRVEAAEAAVVNDLQAVALEASTPDVVREFVRTDSSTLHVRSEIQSLRRQLAEIPAMIDRAEEAMLKGVYTPERFADVREALESQARTVRSAVRSLSAQLAGAPQPDEIVNAVREAAESLALFPDDPHQGRAILHRFIERVVVEDGAITIHYKVG